MRSIPLSDFQAPLPIKVQGFGPQGFTDPREDALKLMARLAYPTLYDPAQPRLGLPRLQYKLLATFYDEGAPAIDRLIQLGALGPAITFGFIAGRTAAGA